MKFDVANDKDYFSDRFEESHESNMQIDTESQVKSELDSSIIQSDSEFSEDLIKPNRQVSGFSTFK